MLAFICGVFLTLTIVVPLMVSRSPSSQKDDKTDYACSLRFDRKSTHSLLFLSDDNTVMANSFSEETPNAVIHPEQLNTYKGTIGDKWLTNTTMSMMSNIREQIKVMSLVNTAGTAATGRLGFFINMNRREFSIIDKDTLKILYTLKKVESADQLCLAFAIYNPELVEAKLEIMYSYDFTSLPIINVIA
ncbi:unnamed protein product [Mytilus edulis]|uniref:Uncharacterized protein n=1 Tax=Mytilus edulis TaxID=6550 RepID=A0A8S3RUE3_MYTED|nr:unnamed protein product [Mytilus edulis]